MSKGQFYIDIMFIRKGYNNIVINVNNIYAHKKTGDYYYIINNNLINTTNKNNNEKMVYYFSPSKGHFVREYKEFHKKFKPVLL